MRSDLTTVRRSLGVIGFTLFLWLVSLGIPPAVVGDQQPEPPSKVIPDSSVTVTIPVPDTTAGIIPPGDEPTTASTGLSIWDILWLLVTP